MNDPVILLVGCSLVLVVLLVLWFTGLGKLNDLSGQVNLTIGTLSAQYQQRLDLIPDALRSARESAEKQKEYFDRLLDIRKRMHPGPTPANLGNVPRDDFPMVLAAFSANASKACHESNPEMDVSAYSELIRTMKATEEDIAGARRFFWSAVTDYNVAVRSIPLAVVAKVHGFTKMPEAEISREIEKKPNYFE